jgi:SNF2 family DNA or RNA helicase
MNIQKSDIINTNNELLTLVKEINPLTSSTKTTSINPSSEVSKINSNCSLIINKLLEVLENYNLIYSRYKDAQEEIKSLCNTTNNNLNPDINNKEVSTIKKKSKKVDFNDDNNMLNLILDKFDDLDDDSCDDFTDFTDFNNNLNSAHGTQANTENLVETKAMNNKTNINYISKKNSKKFNILLDHSLIVNDISNIVLENDKYEAYKYYTKLELNIINNLICEILENTPKSDITTTEFRNIKTELYPYQVNNVNWMLNIEKSNYTEEYDEIREKVILKGGGLFDEVGMGKTLQIITLINHNNSKYISKVKNNKIYTKATLIIAPNHLCGQWLREFDIHLKKSLNIINLLTKKHYNKYTYYDFIKADVIIVSANFFFNCKINQHEEFDPLFNFVNIFNKDVNLFNMYWHRVVIDEYHEIEDSALFEKLKFIESDYRWIISGTPFKEHYIDSSTKLQTTSLSKITDYLSWKTNVINTIELSNINNYNYIKNHFSRNTHNRNITILKLPTIKEETIWLNFTETERMIYNAYLADPNNTAYDVFLRQLCCHPLLSEKLRENMSNKLESLSDMKEHIKKMYFKDYDKSLENFNDCTERIKKITEEMTEMEQQGKINLIGYQNLKEDLIKMKEKIPELEKIKNGKEKTLLYYKKFLELISDMNNVTQQDCPICLDPIKEFDLGITICGHIYCYSCISTIIKESKNCGTPSKCPNCNKNIQLDNIFLISKNNSKDVDNLGTKLAYIINYIKSTPTKYRIIFSQWDYLLKEVGKVLEQNNIKHLYCQGNVYQKDKVLRLFNSKDITNNEYRIIMLSSDSTVSGSNLNNAEEVIFLDPVYGDKQHRLNTENQAIGRVRRLGNKFKEIKVLRLLIKDSIEEEIYKNNIE